LKEIEEIEFLKHADQKEPPPAELGSMHMKIFPDKFCLLWMVHFPEFLIPTWELISEYVGNDDSFSGFIL